MKMDTIEVLEKVNNGPAIHYSRNDGHNSNFTKQIHSSRKSEDRENRIVFKAIKIGHITDENGDRMKTSRGTLQVTLPEYIDENNGIEIQTQQPLEMNKKNKSEKNCQKLLNPFADNVLDALIKNIFYFVGIIVIGVLWSIPLSVIPLTNTILYPSYWWEYIVYGPFFFQALSISGFVVIETYLIFDFEDSTLLRRFCFLYAIDYLALVSIWSGIYLIATVWLTVGYPLPFAGVIIQWLSSISHLTATWFMFPCKMPKDKRNRKKIWAYMFYCIWWILFIQQKIQLGVLKNRIAYEYRWWAMSILLPLTREVNLRIMTNIIKRTVDDDSINHLTPTLMASISMNLTYAFMIAQTVTSSEMTGYCLLVVDYGMNFYDTFKIIQLHRKLSPLDGDETRKLKLKQEMLMLTGVEIAESLVPIMFLSYFCAVFYGNNGDMIGGVKYSEWQYKYSKVTDIIIFSKPLIIMFGFDLFSWMVTGALLWKFASINMIQESYKLLTLFWPLISIQAGGSLFLVGNVISKVLIEFLLSKPLDKSVKFVILTELFE